MTRAHVPHLVRAAHRDGVIAFVLAALVALFFPVAVSAGTETPVLRYATAGVLVLAGALLRGGGSRPALLAAALGLLAVGAVPLSAIWLAGFAVLCAIDAVVAHMRDTAAARRAAPQHAPDAPEDGEATSDIIESVAIAFVYALVVREFSCEAFKIPTESMNPTILGKGGGVRVGDQLLAAKAPLLFGEPKRWSIVVFRYPLFRTTNYIKRLVGMPGELLENRGGDIYANGKIVSKPDEVQETLWFPLFPGPADPSTERTAQEFRLDGDAECRFEAAGATLTAKADKTSWIAHDSIWSDLRASFDADASGLSEAGAVLVRLDGDGRRVEFEARRDGVWLTAPGVARTKLDVAGLGASPARYAFSVADRVVRVWRNGRLAARMETADESNVAAQRDQAWFGVTGGTARLAGIRIERDLQYSPRGPDKWQVPPGCYFMMGDNTGASRDSREWEGFVFRLKDGREYVCDVWPVRRDDNDDRGEPSVRPTPDGQAFEIWDSYGAHRIVAKSDLVDGTYKREPQPFVRREDLVGRAFFTFFPFPPFGDWRPRILP